MSIWKRQLTLDELNSMGEKSMVALLDITFTRIDEESLEAEMPVDERTHQPFGLLHGGASVALAETLGSMAGFLTTAEGQCVVGTEISASHHRAVASGKVRGVCKPLHLSKSSQVWEIAIFDARGKRCCTSRLTTAVLG
ncbi:hotdog fold thioesterase [Enterobacteriaceae bacterium H20N1]|uniref:Hotdog fold thioesterase n=1 Tax=Dryocola boscaweniae TaxID=2925397 RepID=A0A9X2W6B6_9ENTR|nr:hotdog fold thioesterase [Dryocola boscaweniae]MCT4701620.1 hotdog fold thioesterase [Dryocola boscaweniae]MCT4718789.1 hotdog fold thioesterase [Dryocola boscaweniae]